MNVSEMNDGQKSLLLARLMGWKITTGVNLSWVDDEEDKQVFRVDNHGGLELRGLYVPEAFVHAWKVLNWVHSDKLERMYWLRHEFFGQVELVRLSELPMEQAQRVLLDKILELALEFGFVENDSE